MKRYTRLIALIIIGLGNTLTNAQSIDNDTLKIDEIEITAAPALLVPRFHYPGSTERINRKVIQSTWSRTGSEILENATGVWVQKTNHGGGSPIIRGLTGNQVLLLFDGIRLNNSIYRYGPNQYSSMVNPGWINQVDIRRGGGSVEFGSDALGGSVNYLSAEPFFSDTSNLRIDFGTSLGTHYRFQNSTETSATGNILFSNQDFYVRAGYTRSSFGDLISGKPEVLQIASGYFEQAANFKYAYRINEAQTFTMAWFRDIQKNVGRTDKISGEYEKYHFDPQIMDLAYAKWTRHSNNRWAQRMDITFSLNRLEENRIMRKYNSVVRNTEKDLVNTLGGSAVITSAISHSWRAATGVEWYHDRVNSSAYSDNLELAIRTPYRGLYTDKATMQSVSLFSNHLVSLDKWRISFGGRLNNTTIRGQDAEFGDFYLSPTALVGSAGVLYEAFRGVALFTRVSNSFRSPNINDISSFGLFDYGFEVPAPDLNPEKSISTEGGIKYFRNRFSGTLSGYYTQLYDLIVRESGLLDGDSLYQGEKVYRKVNTEKASIKGLEADFVWNPAKRLILSGSVTYTYGIDLIDQSPLRRIPPVFGQLQLAYPINPRLTAGSVFRSAGKQTRLSQGDMDDERIAEGGTPGWYSCDAFLTYTTASWVLSAHILNITNQNYRIHGSGIEQPGTGFLIKLISNF